MSKIERPPFEEVVQLPAGTTDARLETLLDLPECRSGGHQRFVEASRYILDNLKVLETKPVGIHLLGKPGTGKTFAAVALMRAVYEQADAYIGIRPLSQSLDLNTLFSTDNPKNQSHSTPFGPTKDKIGVALLDDVQGDEAGREKLFRATDAVNYHGGLIIVTSNTTDPMFYMDEPEKQQAAIDYMARAYAEQNGISAEQPVNDRNQTIERQRIYSRIAGTFLPIIFEAQTDLRVAGSFWKDF